ncbi:hypothetical protein RF11_08554 [Thelohanellus kitauei]|uniref:Uncharacterized protein n=1 Tax=Thelohanellus kitauei TaxID=669202 RepID=A0A0C2IXR9_THEKT|nr:hypothetical protein RF11_08554 [Thelohanellus kitauei]
MEHSLDIVLSRDKQYVRTIYGPFYWPNHTILDTPESRFQKPILPKSEPFDEDKTRFTLAIHGCHQKMAHEFNRRIDFILNGKVQYPGMFHIRYSPFLNRFDAGTWGYVFFPHAYQD